MVRATALALVLGACGADPIELEIIIDMPSTESAAYPFPDLDTVEMQVAIAGDPQALVTRTFQRGETIEIPDVPYGANLVVHMIGRVGTNEVAVGRTCPFSLKVGEEPPTPHLYFARTVKWAEFPDPRPVADGRYDTRDGATALNDASGNALYIGGVDQTAAALSGIDRFDAMRGAFDQVAKVDPRRNGAAAQLGDGRIAIAGGTTDAGLASDILEIVNLDADEDRRVERAVASTPLVTSLAPAMTSTSDGHVVAFGGACGNCTGADINKPLDSIVDIRADGAGGTEQRELATKLAVARKQHTVTRLSDDIGAPIIVIGGLDAEGKPIARAELYKPLTEQMAAGFVANMVKPRRDHKAVRLPDGSVLVVGGLDADNKPVREIEVFTFDAGFQVGGLIPASAGSTDFTLTPLPDGSILLAGGRDGLDPVFTTFIIRLRPGTDMLDVVTTDRLTRPRARHQATLLCDGTVMLVGGTPVKADPERYNPSSIGRR